MADAIYTPDGQKYWLLQRAVGSQGRWIKYAEAYTLQAAEILSESYAAYWKGENRVETQILEVQ